MSYWGLNWVFPRAFALDGLHFHKYSLMFHSSAGHDHIQRITITDSLGQILYARFLRPSSKNSPSAGVDPATGKNISTIRPICPDPLLLTVLGIYYRPLYYFRHQPPSPLPISQIISQNYQMILEASECFFHEEFQVTTTKNLTLACIAFEQDSTKDFPIEEIQDSPVSTGNKIRHSKRHWRQWHDQRQGDG